MTAENKISILVLSERAVANRGPYRHVVGTLNALACRKDVAVTLLTGGIDEQEPYFKSGMVRIIAGFKPKSPFCFFKNLYLLIRHGRAADIVYVPTNLSSLLYAQVLRPWCRIIAGPNVSTFSFLHGKAHATRIEAGLLCDLWVSQSHAINGYILQEKVPEKHICVIHHAIDHDRFSPLRRDRSVWNRYGIDPSAVVVLFVGRFDDELKGYKVLAEAWKNIRNDIAGCKAVLVLAGKGGREFIEHAQLRDAVGTGWVGGDELAVLYASADISVIPSLWETFSFTTLESLSSGLAVAASNTGGIPEQITPDDNGLLLELVDKQKNAFFPDAHLVLGGALRDLIRDGPKRERLGTNARKRVLEHFTEKRLGADIAEAARACLHAKSSCGAKYLIRFDDICPSMNWKVWDEIEKTLDVYGVKPLLAVIPDNRDPSLQFENPRAAFWNDVKKWQDKGYSIALHGYQHLYETRNPGILGIQERSEFAGLSAESQREKISSALRIFQQHGIRPDCWIAPAHSFDRQTVEVLLELGISRISDGFALFPYRDASGMTYVPQQLWRFRKMPFGLWAVCLDHNGWDAGGLSEFRKNISAYVKQLASFDEAFAAASRRDTAIGVVNYLADLTLRAAIKTKKRLFMIK
ncbi:MAG: hypothetical protein A2583_03790 [Bdellovibrionales bacterium RIFOXYD1_FULL_53_11]|nr:MAG: hypothetical protein A2583_03790 [Bdellovibrionales bacterium RIFOXYD1_FULL_53_11]